MRRKTYGLGSRNAPLGYYRRAKEDAHWAEGGMSFRDLPRRWYSPIKNAGLRYHRLFLAGWARLAVLCLAAGAAFQATGAFDYAIGYLCGALFGWALVLVWDRVTGHRIIPADPPFDPGDPSGDREPREPGPRDPAGMMSRPEPLTSGDDEEFVASH